MLLLYYSLMHFFRFAPKRTVFRPERTKYERVFMLHFIFNNFSLFFSCANLTVACTNPLYIPISWKRKLTLFFLLIPVTFTLGPRFGSFLTPLVLMIAIFYLIGIHAFSIMNLCCFLVGYIWSVCLNNLTLAFLGILGINCEMILSDYLFYFCSAYLILLHLSTCYAGKWFREHIHLSPSPVHQKISPILLIYLCTCTAVFIANITWGEVIGYPPNLILFNSILFLLFFFMTAVLFFFLIRTLQKEQEQTVKLMAYKNLQDYTKKIECLYHDTRRFQHGYINLLTSLHVYIEESGYQPLKKYFQDKILPSRKIFEQNNQQLGRLSYLEIPELKGILYTKLAFALHQGIHLSIDIHEVISEIAMDSLDLVQILGIYLDNATEASILSEAKELYLGMTQHERKTLIVVENSCQEMSENPEKLYTAGYSTKKCRSGIGLPESERILNTYSNIIHTTAFENYYFRQQLEIFPGKEN